MATHDMTAVQETIHLSLAFIPARAIYVAAKLGVADMIDGAPVRKIQFREVDSSNRRNASKGLRRRDVPPITSRPPTTVPTRPVQFSHAILHLPSGFIVVIFDLRQPVLPRRQDRAAARAGGVPIIDSPPNRA